MSSIMHEYVYTSDKLEEIIDSIKEDLQKEIARKIIKLFIDAGLFIKVKHIFYDKPTAYFRVLCFIKKNAEAVIINTRQDMGKAGVVDGLNIQLRIENISTFAQINTFTDNIKKQIINANDCRYCSAKCDGKRYIFSYDGNDYVKCQMICSNFRFNILSYEDLEDIVFIINNDIKYKQIKK